MLSIGQFTANDCHRTSRRSFLQVAASVPLALGLPAATRATEKRIRSVVMINLWGGPSQLDTFDPKPNAASNIRGPFRAIPTRTAGVHFTELMPRLAACQDQFAVVRSTYYRSADHNMRPFTGGSERSGSEPNFGSIAARRFPAREMPSFIAINPRSTIGTTIGPVSQAGMGAGKLGAAYNPFMISCNEMGESDGESLRLLNGLSPSRLDDRATLRQTLDAAQRELDSAPADAWNASRTADASCSAAGPGRRSTSPANGQRPAMRSASPPSARAACSRAGSSRRKFPTSTSTGRSAPTLSARARRWAGTRIATASSSSCSITARSSTGPSRRS